jgi:hypothetical protein
MPKRALQKRLRSPQILNSPSAALSKWSSDPCSLENRPSCSVEWIDTDSQAKSAFMWSLQRTLATMWYRSRRTTSKSFCPLTLEKSERGGSCCDKTRRIGWLVAPLRLHWYWWRAVLQRCKFATFKLRFRLLNSQKVRHLKAKLSLWVFSVVHLSASHSTMSWNWFRSAKKSSS